MATLPAHPQPKALKKLTRRHWALGCQELISSALPRFCEFTSEIHHVNSDTCH
jgi:hypothetical protein